MSEFRAVRVITRTTTRAATIPGLPVFERAILRNHRRRRELLQSA